MGRLLLGDLSSKALDDENRAIVAMFWYNDEAPSQAIDEVDVEIVNDRPHS